MISKKLVFALLPAILTLSSIGMAQILPTDVVKALEGSAWEGTYGAVGETGSVRLAFLSGITNPNELQYFHQTKTSGPILSLIKLADEPCPFTPRTLHLEGSKDSLNGKISVYNCTGSDGEESYLEETSRRAEKKAFPVTTLTLSPDGKSIHLVAIILGVNVEYHLTRKTLNVADLSSPKPLRDWTLKLN